MESDIYFKWTCPQYPKKRDFLLAFQLSLCSINRWCWISSKCYKNKLVSPADRLILGVQMKEMSNILATCEMYGISASFWAMG